MCFCRAIVGVYLRKPSKYCQIARFYPPPPKKKKGGTSAYYTFKANSFKIERLKSVRRKTDIKYLIIFTEADAPSKEVNAPGPEKDIKDLKAEEAAKASTVATGLEEAIKATIEETGPKSDVEVAQAEEADKASIGATGLEKDVADAGPEEAIKSTI